MLLRKGSACTAGHGSGPAGGNTTSKTASLAVKRQYMVSICTGKVHRQSMQGMQQPRASTTEAPFAPGLGMKIDKYMTT